MKRSLLVVVVAALVSCGPGKPAPLVVVPDATLPPPASKVTPPPGPFNGTVELTFETDRPATIFWSTDGSDPRLTTQGRTEGASPLTLTLEATTSIAWFASENGKDEELHHGTWSRAGGPRGTISGVVVVGSFLAGKDIAVTRNFQSLPLGRAMGPGQTELPFVFEGLQSGPHRLMALGDRNGDGVLLPVIDFTSSALTVTLDLTDPYKAAAEGVRLYLEASAPELATLQGTVNFVQPPGGQGLRISALSADAFSSLADPMALLTQLQNGFQVLTNATDRAYPYVITDLKPGVVMPAPVLLGFGSGGLSMNFLANPLRPVTLTAGTESVADFTFGPVALSGTVSLPPTAMPTGLAYGVVAARSSSLTDGLQVVLMPTLFALDAASMTYTGNYGGEALRANSTFALRAFVSTSSMNALTDALTWAVNPFAAQPAQVMLPVGNADVHQDLVAP